MGPYEITSMIIDDDFASEEYVSTFFNSENQNYRITFKKADLEIINSWVFQNGTSLPADLPNFLIDSIRADVKKRINNKGLT